MLVNVVDDVVGNVLDDVAGNVLDDVAGNVLDDVVGNVLDDVVDNVLDDVVDVVLTALDASIAGVVVLEEFSSPLAQKGDDRRRMDCPCIICCRGPSL
jgi:hypothetical protein